MRKYLVCLLCLAGCGGVIRHSAASTTAEILARAQPSLQMESDYELAARAVPGALKTIEGFYVADEQPSLRAILTEGYCQYATAFVEDEWEIAKFAQKLDDVADQNERATKMFTRCMNYALQDLGSGFQKDLFGTADASAKRIAATGRDQRMPLMWVGVGLGGMINHNLDSTDMLSYLPTVKLIMQRVIQLDGPKAPSDCDSNCLVHRALPHIALGMLASGASKQFGGDANVATAEFQQALAITGDRMQLARVLWAYRVGLMTNDRKLFHDQLVKVLETDPAIWPEQRLANEVAHRRARRYLSHEKELFQ
ncbi:MAG: TRAP transporter TatT component family protein [Acidobacteriota bacterium]